MLRVVALDDFPEQLVHGQASFRKGRSQRGQFKEHAAQRPHVGREVVAFAAEHFRAHVQWGAHLAEG